jgi:biopolymer transport protein ExbD
MKIKGAKQVHYDSGPNMTPLVDVVMVILIFLMLAGTFGANEHFLTSNLPLNERGVGQVEPKPGQVPDEVFELQILSDANYGFRVLAGDINSQGRVADRDWLEAKLKAKKAQFDKAGTPVDQIQVVLSPTNAVKYEHIAQVYEAVLAAQFKKVAFRASGQ